MSVTQTSAVNETVRPRGRKWRWVIALVLLGCVGIGLLGRAEWWRKREWEKLVERLQGKEFELQRIVRGRDWPVPLPGYLRDMLDAVWPQDVSVYAQTPYGSYLTIPLNFDDGDLQAISAWGEITLLSTANSVVTDEGVKALSRMPRLRELYLNGAEITDAGLSEIGKVKTLRWLSLAGSKVSDKGLAALKSLPHLEVLVLSLTEVTDNGLLSLADIPALKRVEVADTAVTEKGMAEFLKRRPKVIVSRKMPWDVGWPKE